MRRILPTPTNIEKAIRDGREPSEVAKAVMTMARLKNALADELRGHEADAVREVTQLKPIAEMTEVEIQEAGLRIIQALGTERAVTVWGHYSRGFTQRAIVQMTGLSLGTVNATLRNLDRAGYIKLRKRGGVNPKNIEADTYDPHRMNTTTSRPTGT